MFFHHGNEHEKKNHFSVHRLNIKNSRAHSHIHIYYETAQMVQIEPQSAHVALNRLIFSTRRTL